MRMCRVLHELNVSSWADRKFGMLWIRDNALLVKEGRKNIPENPNFTSKPKEERSLSRSWQQAFKNKIFSVGFFSV